MGERLKWAGGYVRIDADGRKTYWIEREIRKHRFHFSTHCHGDKAAHKVLERFEADPFNFRIDEGAGGGVFITPELIAEYVKWSMAPESEGGLANTKLHAKSQGSFLVHWLEDIGGTDIRHLKQADLEEKLDARRTCRQKRIAALKHFMGWWRGKYRTFSSAEDPTIDLKVPQSKGGKQIKKARPLESVMAVLNQLAEWQLAGFEYEYWVRERKGEAPKRRVARGDWHVVRAWLLAGAATGWHVTELERFKAAPVIRELKNNPEGVAVLEVWHKNQKTHPTTLRHQAQLDVMRMLIAAPKPQMLVPRIKAAAAAVNAGDVRPGTMRHSVANWMRRLGKATKQEAADILGHDVKTFEEFYENTEDFVPPAPKLPLLT
jgi:hypothetical protein